MFSKKKVFIIFLIIAMLITFAGVIGIYKITSGTVEEYYIYYGDLNNKIIEKLKNYKVVVIEPRNATTIQINMIKENGTLVYGYTSFVEQNENNIEFQLLKNNWFYTPNGQKIKYEHWESFIMDLSKKDYQDFLIEQVNINVIDKGCDGLLIDTIGDIDDSDWSVNDKRRMREGYSNILSELTNLYPDLLIIQNWGFETINESSASYLNGVMWEEFSFNNLDNDEWVLQRFKEIEKKGLDFYIVSSNETLESCKRKYSGDLYLFNWSTDIYN